MAGCLSGRRFEFLDVKCRLRGSWIIWALPMYWISVRFFTLLCTLEDTERKAAKRCEVSSMSVAFVTCSWNVGLIYCLVLGNACAPRGERAAWKAVVGTCLFAESLLIPSLLFAALVNECRTFLMKERSVHLVGLPFFWTSCSWGSFFR